MRRLLTVLLALAVAACGDGRSSAERAAEQGIVIVGNNQEPQSLDPHKATAVADGKIICAMLEGLMPAEHPGMAETWEHNADASVWTFHLRDAQWSDGRPVTAQDFAYAYRRLLHPDFGGKYAEMLYPIRNAEAYNRGQCKWEAVGVEVPDARTLRLTLEGPTPHLPKLVQHYTWFPVPAHAVEAHGGMLDRRSLWTRAGNWVGNGAYVLHAHRYNDFLEVRANPRYWRASEVRNRGIRFMPIVNGYTETRMFFDGKLHITNNVPPELIAMAKERAGEQYCQDPYYCAIFYRLNTTRPPLDNPLVRRALYLAIDRDSLVTDVVRGAGTPAYTFTPPGAGYTLPQPADAALTEQQREQTARDLLAQAGYPGGKGFPNLEIMTTSRDVQRVMAETVQSMWEKTLGIHVEIRSCEWTAYKAAQQNMEYDISSSSWSGDYLDPATFVELWRSGGGNNCTGWGNAACDAALAEARAATSEDARTDALQRAESTMLQELPVIPLYWSSRTYLKSADVRGWVPRLLDDHPLDAVEVGRQPQP
ncbi:MAG: peptide ABC transporter substrate-binding protein [Akkermansia sp.]|nr:peptide ABC transporter substrate-binding protein [Akkermansia sp.]